MTKEEFYKDLNRKFSRELDYGVWWHDLQSWPAYRVTWVENTGELISVDSHSDKYEILGIIKTEEEVEKVMENWAEKCGQINSLEWVKSRVGRGCNYGQN